MGPLVWNIRLSFYRVKCFTLEECQLLQSVLADWGLDTRIINCNKAKKTYRIRFTKASMPRRV